MDPRIERHAEIVVDHCVEIEPGDMVQVSAPTCAEDLVVALYEKIGKRGGRPTLTWINRPANRAYLRAVDPNDCIPLEHTLALIEETDARITIYGHRNTVELSDIPDETRQAIMRAGKPIQDAQPDRGVLTQYPGPGNAQHAEMSTEAYESFVWNAVNKDWDEQRAFQAQLVEILDPAEEVRVVSGSETDLIMSVAKMTAVNEFGERNLPGGEVYTAPVPESVEGEVFFDMPVVFAGNQVEDVHLEFEAGEVVNHSAGKNEDALTSILETDEGARRLGELGIGMNRDIDEFTYNMLFDEKMGDTVHFAVGRSLDKCVPEGVEGNDSTVHVDMLVDMSEDSFIEVDGEVVQRDGTFVFEDGFEA